MGDQITGSGAIFAVAGVALILVVHRIWIIAKRNRLQDTAPPDRHLGETIRQLRSSGAQWPTITATLNPRNDPTIAHLLHELRGPHMFVPQTALNIIEDAHIATSRGHSNLSVGEVLKSACASMRTVTRLGD
jgi:hypothetical protein